MLVSGSAPRLVCVYPTGCVAPPEVDDPSIVLLVNQYVLRFGIAPDNSIIMELRYRPGDLGLPALP